MDNFYLNLEPSTFKLDLKDPTLKNNLTIVEWGVTSATKGYYHLDSNGTDSSTFGYNATGTAVYTSGVKGSNALQMSGFTYYLDTTTRVIPSGMKTISFWFKKTSGPDFYGQLLSNSYVFGGVQTGTTIYTAGGGNLSFQIQGGGDNAGSNGLYTLTSSGIPMDGGWHHIVCQWDGTSNSNSGKIYVDGILDSQSTNTKSENPSGGSNLMIGNRWGGTATYGILDELIIENTYWDSTFISYYYSMSKLKTRI